MCYNKTVLDPCSVIKDSLAMAALRSNGMNRYHSYSSHNSGAGDREDSSPECERERGHHPTVNGIEPPARTSNASGRLEHIINSMAYIRGELVSRFEILHVCKLFLRCPFF